MLKRPPVMSGDQEQNGGSRDLTPSLLRATVWVPLRVSTQRFPLFMEAHSPLNGQ